MFDAAVMHDFFVDRLVHTKDLNGLLGAVRAKAEAGGGGIHGVTQSEVRGGNAVNLAHALARLGLRTLLLTHTDRAHERLLLEAFDGLDAEVRAKPMPPGLTVAFEERLNVMLGEGGGASDFGPNMLDEEDWGALSSSKVVCSVNWAANSRGTELLASLRRKLGAGKTVFFDPADFRDRRQDYSELMKMIGDERLVDWMSTNEHEALAAAEILGFAATDLDRACLEVGKRLRVELDVHCADRSLTSREGGVVTVPATGVRPKRFTGAGDVWAAASIYGRLNRMKPESRLGFANAAAGLYIAGEAPVPPTLDDVNAALE